MIQTESFAKQQITNCLSTTT